MFPKTITGISKEDWDTIILMCQQKPVMELKSYDFAQITDSAYSKLRFVIRDKSEIYRASRLVNLKNINRIFGVNCYLSIYLI